MAGWSRQKRQKFEAAFYDFLNHYYINSRDGGQVCLGANLYDGQIWFITTVFDGLEAGIHKFFVLKSRQLGITTICRALSVFYIGLHRGLGGALVFDTAPNKESARRETETAVVDLDPSLRFPSIKHNNRDSLILANDASIAFMSAGVRKTKSSGTLGRSRGLSMAHLSEICSYDNDEGLEAFENSLSEDHPDRLYIYESTARGFNRWWELWIEAKKDPHCKCLFLGWWSKPSQRIARNDPDFQRYGVPPPTPKELEKIREVRERYGYEIKIEQLAWVRRKMNPAAQQEGDAELEFEGSVTRMQEQPWTEDEAFQQSGAVFFAPKDLRDMTMQHVSNKFETYWYSAGVEFADMKIHSPAPSLRMAELKVWEKPDPEGIYVIAADPAFGENENNDRSAAQVMRAYSDGLDQAAEYASPLINTRQFAWVIASLLGWYGADLSEVYLILELNGPGHAVWNELRSLRQQLQIGYNGKDINEKGLQRVFTNVRNFLYSRNDAVLPGKNNWHMKTTTPLKVMMMERCRDFVSNGMLHIRSLDTVEEMRTITREGDSIKAPGNMKDDKAFSTALSVHCWDQRVRPKLMQLKRTRAADAARKRLLLTDQIYLFNQNNLQHMFETKRRLRMQADRQQARMGWRYSR